MDRDKRETILDAAARAFEKLGFKKTSIDAIARAAGVAKGTVYLACPSKEELFYQAVHRDLRDWIGEVGKMIDPRQPADRLLCEVAEASMIYMQSRPLVRNLIGGVYHGELPGWAARFDELRGLAQANVAEIVRQGVRQGRFRPDLDIDTTAAVLLDIQHAGYVMMARAGGQVSGEELLVRLRAGLDLVLHGLVARPTPARSGAKA
jgi:TetR/AcrR family transcriptional regulator, cholesterol catabolism regulator